MSLHCTTNSLLVETFTISCNLTYSGADQFGARSSKAISAINFRVDHYFHGEAVFCPSGWTSPICYLILLSTKTEQAQPALAMNF